jgi:putative viral A-type inclusion protein
MKFLKLLLVLTVIAVISALGGVIFSNKIITYMTKTDNSRFENLRYSIANGEISFDDFVLNGEKLGKGKAKIRFTRGGFLGIIPKMKLTSLELQQIDMNIVYNAPDQQIDTFIQKINIPQENPKAIKTTESYIKETAGKIDILNKDIDKFFADRKIKIDIINRIKQEYIGTTDLKTKSQKLTELNRELQIFIGEINSEKTKINNEIADIEIERNIMLENISEDLLKLEKLISLNDIQNINSYIFLEKGKEISISLNKSLKAVKFIKKIKNNLKLSVSDISINNGEIVFNGLEKGNKTVKGEVIINNNIKANIFENEKGYEIIYNGNDLTLKTLFGDKINTDIEYIKQDLLQGKSLNLISELSLENNNFRNLNKTVLSEDDKKLLTEKINNMKSTRYNEIMTQYQEQTKSVENMISGIYEKGNKLDKFQRELLSLNTVINISDFESNINQGGITSETEKPKEILNNDENTSTDSSAQKSAKDITKELNKIFR